MGEGELLVKSSHIFTRRGIQRLMCTLKRCTYISVDVLCQNEILASLTQERALLDTVFSVVRAEQTLLEICRRRHHNSLQLIARLPVEILSHIFLLTYLGDNETFKETECQYPALSVSHFWRTCVISIPQLWTTLCLDRADFSASSLQLLRELGTRSGNLPCQLRLRVDENTIPRADSINHALSNFLLRCQSLHIRIWDADSFATAFPLQVDFPSLKQLRVKFENHLPENCSALWHEEEEESDVLPWGVISIFRNCPITLTSMVLTSNLEGFAPRSFYSFSNLSYLDINSSSISLPTILAVLPRLPNLEVLIWGSDRDTGDRIPSTQVCLPSLVRLCLLEGSRYCVTLLDHIMTPCLKSLTVGTGLSQQDTETIKRFLAGLSPNAVSSGLQDLTMACQDGGISRVLEIPGLSRLYYTVAEEKASERFFSDLRKYKSYPRVSDQY